MVKYLHLELIALSAVCPARLMDGMIATRPLICISCQAKITSRDFTILWEWTRPRANHLIEAMLVSDRERTIPWNNMAFCKIAIIFCWFFSLNNRASVNTGINWSRKCHCT